MAKVMLSVSVDWEGQNLEGVDRVVELGKALPGVPLTHFVSAAYFCRGFDPALVASLMAPAFRPIDELGLHVHTWMSLHGYQGGDALPNYSDKGWQPWPVDYRAGSQLHTDYGYTTALSALDSGDLYAFLQMSPPLLGPLVDVVVRRGLDPRYVFKGFRAGGWMAADDTLRAVAAQGFAYDASAADAALAAKASGTLASFLARLWGPKPETDRWLANQLSLKATNGAGVSWGTQPFVVVEESGARLLEMPDNGMLLPYLVTPASIAESIQAALDLPQATFYLSVGFHQEPPPFGKDYLKELVEVLAGYAKSSDIVWLRSYDAASAFLAD